MDSDTARVERKPSKRLYKVTLGVMKLIPMLLALCAVLNTIFCFVGIKSDVLSMFGGISFLPLIFLYLTSYLFGFCRYHRMFLHYVLVANVITLIEFYIGIPVSDEILMCIMSVITCVFLFLILYYYRREKCCRLSEKSC